MLEEDRLAKAAEYGRRAADEIVASMDRMRDEAAMAVSRDLQLATAAYELYAPTGQDVGLIDLVNETGISGGFNVLSEVLHQSAILALCNRRP